MGFFDDLINKPFGGMFDFNRDGKEDLFEQAIGVHFLKECMKEKETAQDSNYGYFPVKDDWRLETEDGSDYDIYPELYDNEQEYLEALQEAIEDKQAWTENEIINSDNYVPAQISIPIEITIGNQNTHPEIKESDYPNKRQYNAAVTLANTDWVYINKEFENAEKSRCKFILENADKIIAANYLTNNGNFIYAQAIKDNFELPVTLPDEDEKSEITLNDIIKKIDRKDSQKAVEVYAWCIDNFLPYCDYTVSEKLLMTDYIIDSLYDYSESYPKALSEYLNKFPSFRQKLIRGCKEMPDKLAQLIVNEIQFGNTETAKAMFDDGMFLANGNWKKVNTLFGNLILYSKNYDELETIEFIELEFLPIIKMCKDGMILDEIDSWQSDIDKYKAEVERNSEKYAYSRSNAWRATVPDGTQYNINPIYYRTEADYMKAYNDAKYSWRRWSAGRAEMYGLNIEDYETEEEFNLAWKAVNDEQYKKKQEERQGQQATSQTDVIKPLNDNGIYTYCSVLLPDFDKPLSYRTDDESIKLGDTVVVPFGKYNTEKEGKVVAIGQYTYIAVPYPPEKTKSIIRKL